MRFGLDAMSLGWSTPSGIRTILRELVPALLGELGEDTLLLWQNDLRAPSRPLACPRDPRLERRTCRLPPRVLQALWRRIDWPCLEALAGPLDVFHSPQGRLPAARRARLVLSLNDFRHRRLPHLYPGARWYPREIARADHFIAISESTRRDALEYLQVPPERITTIHLGPPAVRTPVDPSACAAARARSGLEGPYIFCPSSSDPRKNAEGAVEGFLRMTERLDCPHRLALVGSLPPGLEGGLRRRAGARAAFTGVVSDEDYAALLAGAEAVVEPSLCEGFGFPVLEAFQVGVPQAVAEGTALPEVAGPAALTFDPRDPDDIARALGRLVAEEDLRLRLVEEGRRRLEDFSWEKTARETLDVYRLLAGRERSPVFRKVPAGAW